MFKAAFPWAKHSEERAEKDYLKTLDTASTEEVAGNIWVAEATGGYQLATSGWASANSAR